MRSKYADLIRKKPPATLRERLSRFWDRTRFYFYIPLILGLFFAAAESAHPFFFLQDDTHAQFIPVMAHLVRAVQSGTLALYNFHQYLGVPVLSSGIFGVLYPFTYISAGLSYLLFGHIFAAADIWAALHLLMAGYGFFFLLRELGFTKRVSFFGAISWMLNPCVIFLGSSWWFIMPVAAFLPWLLRWSARVIDSPSKRAMLTLCGLRTVFFFCGHLQFFLYTVIAEIGFIALREIVRADRRINRAAITRYAVSYVLTFILSMPLLLPMFQQVELSIMKGGRGLPLAQMIHVGANSALMWVWGLVWPFSEDTVRTGFLAGFFSDYIENSGKLVRLLPYFAHLGYAVTALCCVFWFRPKKAADGRYGFVSAILAVFFLLWSFGLYDKFIHLVPVLRNFRYSFKLLVFANFFLVLLAAVNLASINEWSRRTLRSKNIFGLLVFAQVAEMLVFFAVSPRCNFTVRLENLPLAERNAGDLSGGRIFSIGEHQDSDRTYDAALLSYNYATLFNLYHFGGYEPLVPHINSQITGTMDSSAVVDLPPGELRNVLPLLRQWGVNRYIVSRAQDPQYRGRFLDNGLTLKFSDENRSVYADDSALPMAYRVKDNSSDGLKCKTGINTITVESDSEKGGPVALNFAYNPFFKVYVDGWEMPVIRTDLRQLAVYMGTGQHTAVFKYRDPSFIVGVWLAGVLLLLLIIYNVYKARKGRQ